MPEDGKFELHWIGVHPSAHRGGFGPLLLADAEDLVVAGGGHQLTISTSTAPATQAARSFYARKCYERSSAYVPDFYGPGEGKVTFTKILEIE